MKKELKKKILTLLLVTLMAFCATMTAFAGAPELEFFSETYTKDVPRQFAGLDSFEITSGILKEHEVTFGSERLVVGSAPADTAVSLEIFKWDPDQALFESVSLHELNVGASGIFSQNIELGLGENYILITAVCDGQMISLPRFINRKSAEIKRQLETGIVLPGTPARE